MGALKLLALAAAVGLASPSGAETVADWRPFIAEASRRFGLPAAWIERVMQAESAGRTTLGGRPITSRAGAVGLMQLMPETWQAMRTALRLGRDPTDPHDNILAGSCYLRAMLDRFGYPGLFAAYNAGPGRYAAFLSGRATLPGETRIYLARVTKGSGATPEPIAPPSVFVALAGLGPEPSGAAAPLPDSSLFVVRHDQ